MSDYISREAVIKLLTKVGAESPDSKRRTVAKCINEIELLSTANVEPVRHGEWGRIDDDWDSLSTFQCSVCGEEWCFEIDEDLPSLNYNYCPNCGAKMVLEEVSHEMR